MKLNGPLLHKKDKYKHTNIIKHWARFLAGEHGELFPIFPPWDTENKQKMTETHMDKAFLFAYSTFASKKLNLDIVVLPYFKFEVVSFK